MCNSSVSTRSLTPWLALGLLSIVGLPALVVAAESVPVYRCVAADGAVSLQDQPCPADSESDYREFSVEAGSSRKARPAPLPTAPARDADTQPSRPEPGHPVPQRWRCVDYAGEVRISERHDPRGHWVPAWVLGYSSEPSSLAGRAGRPAPSLPSQPPPAELASARSRAQPQVYVEDRCRPMAADEVCQYLRQQLGETQRKFFNQQPSGRRESEAIIEDLRRQLSGC